MIQSGWTSLGHDGCLPRCFETGDEGWFRYAMVSPYSGAPIGLRKLKQLRSSSLSQRKDGAELFAAKAADFLPPAGRVSFMPSSTRQSVSSDERSIAHLVLVELRKLRPDLAIVEALQRAAPVPSVHENRIHDVDVLRSTLEPLPTELASGVLYVLDDMVATGATYAAFRRALLERWPDVKPVLLALVHSPRRPSFFE
jgi:hypothetical protein